MTLREHLKKKKITQLAFAALCGIDQALISKYVRYVQKASTENRLAIAKATKGAVHIVKGWTYELVKRQPRTTAPALKSAA